MSFSFGFSGDDIEQDPNDTNTQDEIPSEAIDDTPPPIPAQTHSLDDLLSTLPDKISYSVFTTTSPKGNVARLPRRELFDVRLQLMAEDEGASSTPLIGLDDSDVRPNVYEGGFKTWECSVDLVRFLLDRGPRKDLDDLVRVNHVIEMGCGSALPSMLLFQYALRNAVGMYFTLTDYNADVLRLVTVPNLVLAWASALSEEEGRAVFGGEGNPVGAVVAGAGGEQGEAAHGDLYLTSAVVAAFKARLAELGVVLTLVSGSWSPVSSLLSLVPSDPALNTFVLASETIYSPAALSAFTEAMVAFLQRVRTGKAVVAAKRVYFGVGGSVDGFRVECGKRGCVAYEVEFEGLEVGVRRCLVEVQMY